MRTYTLSSRSGAPREAGSIRCQILSSTQLKFDAVLGGSCVDSHDATSGAASIGGGGRVASCDATALDVGTAFDGCALGMEEAPAGQVSAVFDGGLVDARGSTGAPPLCVAQTIAEKNGQ
jgi:hypothetical protein